MRQLVHLALCSVLVLAGTACSDDADTDVAVSDAADGGDPVDLPPPTLEPLPPPTTPPAAPSQSFATPPPVNPADLVFPLADQCPDDTTEISWVPETQQEVVLAGTLRACEHDLTWEVTFVNAGPAVWVLEQPAREWSDVPNADVRLDIYRQIVRDVGVVGLTIEPQQLVTVTVPDGYPIQLSLRLDAAAQAAWEVTTRGVQAAQDELQDRAVAYLSRGKPGRQAVLTCGVNAAMFAARHPPAGGRQLSYDELYLDIAKDGGECALAVRNARQQQPPTATLGVADFAPGARRGATAANLSRASLSVSGALVKLCVGLPRPC